MKRIVFGLMVLLVGIGVLAGCKQESVRRSGHEDRDRFIEDCRRTAMRTTSCEDFDEQQFKYDYKVVFANTNYLSFYTEEFCYLGGVHGGTHIEVGTFERKTGRRMRVADFIPEERFPDLKDVLYYGAVQKLGGEYHLLNEVCVTENFYLGKDGLHFIYNEYEIAPYADGSVDIVIDPHAFERTHEGADRVPFSAYYSHDRKIAVKFPIPLYGKEGRHDPEDGRDYHPVYVYHFGDGGGQTTVVTNWCALSYPSGMNWEARTKDEHFVFIDKSSVCPEGTPENELHEIIVREEKGNEKTIYLEWIFGSGILPLVDDDVRLDRVCEDLFVSYTNGLAEVAKKNKSCELTTQGDRERTQNAWRYTLAAYRKIAKCVEKEGGEAGVKRRRMVETWLAGEVEKMETKFRKDQDGGTYAGIFFLGNKVDLYNRAIKMLLLKSEVAKRWARVSSATWKIKDKTVAFTNGAARVELSWHIFEPKPFNNAFPWIPYYRPEDACSWGGKDYAFVRFPAEGNLEGYPTTTEESMLFEFDHAVVTRIVGLHNYLNDTQEVDDKNGRLILLGKDGYFNPVRFVIDLESMKILKEGTTLPTDYIDDEYDKLFLDGR